MQAQFGQAASWHFFKAVSFQLSYFGEEESGLWAQSIKALLCMTAQLGHLWDKKKKKRNPHSWLGGQRTQPWGKGSLPRGLESLGKGL